ncbi:hypothetical protein GE09DRAFT_1053684 [Coniochaeta sp. 2T2.1]|nr:hypothetical protein GE09DRAFT_1053684 [Coniochaeta sp. 2T2.1]
MPVLQAIAAILYDQECQGTPPDDKEPSGKHEHEHGTLPDLPATDVTKWAIPWLFKRMLGTDYDVAIPPPTDLCESVWQGIAARKELKKIDIFSAVLIDAVEDVRDRGSVDGEAWSYISRWLSRCCRGFDVADAALMLCYRHTSPRRLLLRGQAGVGGEPRFSLCRYTGVLREMVDEIPSQGPGRLLRRLSVDVNEMVPKVVYDCETREKLVAAAERVAEQHGLCLYLPPDVKALPRPQIDVTHLDGFERGTYWGTMLFGLIKNVWNGCPLIEAHKAERRKSCHDVPEKEKTE